MLTLHGHPYTVTLCRTSDVYGGSRVSCDGCASFVDGEVCFHSTTIFGGQCGGFDLCKACFAKLRVVNAAEFVARLGATPLTRGMRVRIEGLVSKPELNNLVGVVVNAARYDDRVGVRVGEREYLVHDKNLLLVPSFVRIEDDTLRIVASDEALVTIDGSSVTRREIPLVDLGWGAGDEHSVCIDDVAHALTVDSCAMCLQTVPDARLHDHHPVRVCDACAAQLRGRSCPFCTSEGTRRVVIAFFDLPLGTSEVPFVAQVGALSASYELRLDESCLEVVAKDHTPAMQDVGTRHGHAGATHVVGNGKSCVLRPPHGFTTRLHQSYTASMAFLDVVPSDAQLLRSCDDDSNEPVYVDGLIALERAKFSLTERRVALCLCVAHGNEIKWMHVFFSRNPRMPGIVCVMPDPSARNRVTRVLIADFYDPRCWRASLPAVNHNDRRAFAVKYT